MGFVINKKPIQVEKGDGPYLYDENGEEYLDFGASYAVTVTGHNHPQVVEAVKDQLDELIYVQSSYPNSVRKSFEEELVSAAPEGLSNVWLSNSGSEANEAALKFARSATTGSKIVAAKRGFHGRTAGSLSATWKKKYREPFEPLLDAEFVRYNDIEELEAVVDEDTAAVILEPIQGEGGLHPATREYLQTAREITEENDAVLVLDEIQTGLGRTGEMWRCESVEVTPDIITVAKGLAGGFPLGATICRDWIAENAGPHGSTFSGSPAVTAAGRATLSVIEDEGLVENASEVGSYMMSRLEELENRHSFIRDVRGEGLMVGVELRRDANKVLKNLALEHGVLALPTGRTVLRLLPPLTIEEGHVDKFVEALEKVIEDYE